jgi:hypothetical protein
MQTSKKIPPGFDQQARSDADPCISLPTVSTRQPAGNLAQSKGNLLRLFRTPSYRNPSSVEKEVEHKDRDLVSMLAGDGYNARKQLEGKKK